MENSPITPNETGKYQFILFISGMSVKSSHAIENLRHICDTYIPDNFELRIIDITRDHHYAVEYQIFAIPTLIKPVRTHQESFSVTCPTPKKF